MRLSGIKADAAHLRDDRSKIGVSCLGAILLMATASACTAQSASSGPVELYCSIKGVKLLSPTTTAASVCGEIKRELDSALAEQTRTVKSVAGLNSAEWIRIDVQFAQPGTASAAVVQRTGGHEVVHPEIAVDVMDKSLGFKEVERLAAEIARAVAKTRTHK